MKLLFIRLEIVLFLSFGGSFSLFAQFVRNDRMFSFEESEVPACMSSENSKLSISAALSLFNVTDAVLPACKFQTQGAPKFF